jgi:hypothetical protein
MPGVRFAALSGHNGQVKCVPCMSAGPASGAASAAGAARGPGPAPRLRALGARCMRERDTGLIGNITRKRGEPGERELCF